MSLADGARVSNPDADIPTGNEVCAARVDVRVPAEELSHRDGILVSLDDVPASIAGLHLVVGVTFNSMLVL